MGQYEDIKQDIGEIKLDIKDIKKDVAEHMRRTDLNEQRIDNMEEFAKTALDTQQKNFELMLKSNKDNQEAMNKQLKILITIFAGLAALVTAFAAFFG